MMLESLILKKSNYIIRLRKCWCLEFYRNCIEGGYIEMLREVGPSGDQTTRFDFLIGMLQIAVLKEEVQMEP